MNDDEFSAVLDRRIKLIKHVLDYKSADYSREKDKLHNFKRAAKILGVTPEKALLGMYIKHLTSVLDIVDDIEQGKLPTEDILEEKIGDSINYHILLEALINERINQRIKNKLGVK